MSKLTDTEIDLARSDIIAVIKSHGIELHQHGKEYRAICPFHGEHTPSFTVTPSKGRYHCFGCGVNGDAIEFVMKFTNTDFRSAVQIINGDDSGESIKSITPRFHTEDTPKWVPCEVVPDDAPDPMTAINQLVDGKWISYHSSDRWAYYNENALLIGYIYRFDLPNGGKITAPQTWCMSKDGELSWRWQSFPKPRPVFGLDLLMAHPLASVLIVEGEKTCCAARQHLLNFNISNDKVLVIAWAGGGNAAKHTNWSPLIGRKICLWPDADQKDYKEPHQLAGQRMPFMEQPGIATMLEIYHLLGSPTDCKFIIPPSGVPDGWDLADDFPNGFNLLSHLKSAVLLSDMDFSNMHDISDDNEEPLPILSLPNIEKEIEPEHSYDEESDLENPYFRILGYDHGNYYIFQYKRGQIDAYSVGSFTEKGLLSLAPLQWLEDTFPMRNGSLNVSMAVDYILRTAEQRGIYDIGKVRGRGAWIDKKRVVFHHGDFLTVDSKEMGLTEFKSSYVYEMGKVFPPLPKKTLTDEVGKSVFEMATEFRWTTPGSGVLLAGWIALAPMCGALKWRPHIWIQGGPASGKSTIFNEFVHPLLHNMDLYVLGGTTEPGLRQQLQGDALPVLFDESESNTEKDSLRIQSILSLIRQSSSETHAKTLKGSSSGIALSYHIRSMFCLSSIQTALTEQADKERVTILTLKPKLTDMNKASEFWQAMLIRLNTLMSDEDLPGLLVRRSLTQLPVTLENIKTFTQAAAEHFGAQREGDQYGTLLAGAWSLISNTLVSKDEALDYIKLYSWDEYRENSDSNDSETAFTTLMSTFIKIPGYQDVPVGDLILILCDRRVDGLAVKKEEARNHLSNYGMRVENSNELIICNNHIQLNSLMKHTPFSADLKSVLLRYKGAKKLDRKYRFSGIIARVYSIPLDSLLNDDNQVDF